MLTGAPLPVKLAFGLMKPLVGMLETAIAETQDDADALLGEAQNALRVDAQATAMLGSDISIGAVFSSASSNINGLKSVQLQCQCAGSTGSGIVAMQGEAAPGADMVLVQLQLQVGGRMVTVPTLRSGGAGAGGTGGSRGARAVDGVIDIDAT